METRTKTLLLGVCLAAFWTSIFLCWFVGPPVVWSVSTVDPGFCDGLSEAAVQAIGWRNMGVVALACVFYGLPIPLLVLMHRWQVAEQPKPFPRAALILYLASVALTLVIALGDAWNCGSAAQAGPFQQIVVFILRLAAVAINIWLVAASITTARAYVMRPD